MTCPMCRGAIKKIERTNPRVITDIVELFHRLRLREERTPSGPARLYGHGQDRPGHRQQGSRDYGPVPTNVYRPTRQINPVATGPPSAQLFAYRPPVTNRGPIYYTQPISYVPASRQPFAPFIQPRTNRRRIDNERPSRYPSYSSSSNRGLEYDSSREVQLLRDIARTRSKPMRGWSMPDTGARSQLVQYIRTRDNSGHMCRFGSQSGESRFGRRR